MDRLPLGKTCTKCKTWKLFEEYSPAKQKRDGRKAQCKSCRAAWQSSYYRGNREQCLTKMKARYWSNPKLKAEYDKERREEKREELNAQKRRYYYEVQKHRLRKPLTKEEKQYKRAYDRQRYSENREAIKARVRLYQKCSINAKVLQKLYRARKYASPGTFTASEWTELCEACDYRCLACGQKKSLTADHVIPLSKGGTNYISNIQCLCKSCNSSKGARTIDYR